MTSEMCSERDSPLEPFVLPAPGQPELARITCGAHLGPPVLTRKQKRPRVNSLVCDRATAFCAAGPPEALSWMSRLVTQAAKRERELARAHSQRLKQATLSLALDPCLIYDTDRYGWIWGSLCACAPARRHCRRLQPIAIGYSRPSSWPERSHAGMATKISDYGCSGLDRNTWTNSVLICDLWICREMRYSLYVRRNARFFHLYENLKLQDRLISLTH